MASPSSLADLSGCFEGGVPAVIATASADGTPNVTYLSRVRHVDDHRVALSNQFFSKTAQNLTENPQASLLVIEPRTYAQFRLSLVYERTERRGPLFERLRQDVDLAAALHGMQDVFRLRAADIYRVTDIEQILADVDRRGIAVPDDLAPVRDHGADAADIAELSARLARCTDLDRVVSTALATLAERFGHQHSILFLTDEECEHLFTIASHGYDREGVGSEVAVGDGVPGLVASRCEPIRVANVRQVEKYSRTIRREMQTDPRTPAGRDIPVPGLEHAKSQLAVPAMAMGELIGVLMVEDLAPIAFDAADESVLTVVASMLAMAVEADRARERLDEDPDSKAEARSIEPAAVAGSTETVLVRFFSIDGSVFIDGDYLIKGVAGRLLWALLGHYQREGRTDFTNREVRLDPTLDLPPFRDNFESRLILLKRRLDEHSAPVRIVKTGRGRFRVVVDAALRLEAVGQP